MPILTNGVWLLTQVPLLDEVPDTEDVSPGWIALVVLLLLGLATVLLWLSMRKQLRNIRISDRPGTARDDPTPGPSGGRNVR